MILLQLQTLTGITCPDSFLATQGKHLPLQSYLRTLQKQPQLPFFLQQYLDNSCNPALKEELEIYKEENSDLRIMISRAASVVTPIHIYIDKKQELKRLLPSVMQNRK